ncbi:uncharacterized protein F4822DRAFT_382603 [Hypoxylon trugodes]|uniref:uncharacterized protein n=1 Tax=Hypoxylon trugodes TaxID=326681 RepID=UPI0021A1F98B|nr:uncharacterized protein F4822DRAFT_382603 [Hypoxylon trugodes]KAI1385082.1 hypothetical protein F4822DRAFT_382603 [Hypoxylon trugodes]
MEPVPETERMEEFRSSPLPTLRLHQPTAINTSDLDLNRKPVNTRRSTEPPSPSSPSWATASLPYRPRTTSPLSGVHTRSKSVASLAPPTIGRTRSMPGVDGSGRIIYPPTLRPDSPSGSPSRNRAPRKAVDEAYPPTSPIRSTVLESEKRHTELSSSSNPGITTFSNPTHRRTSSPLRFAAFSTSSSTSSLPGTPSATASSPSFKPEGLSNSYSFPSYYPSSSIPSTPSSMRSRSPSISSLETIPDSPDAEEAALEAERIAQLKAAADAAEDGDSGDAKGRGSLDVPTRGRTLGIGSRDKRKRWSVCGAERRGDLDLETIWED